MSIPQFVINHVEEKREDFQALVLTLKNNQAHLNEVEKFAGLPVTEFMGFGTSKDVAKPKPKPKPLNSSRASLVKQFGHLHSLRGNDKLREAVRINQEYPELNKSHLSRSLGRKSQWFGLMLHNARVRGLV